MTNPMNATVEKIEELLKKAAPGPWNQMTMDGLLILAGDGVGMANTLASIWSDGKRENDCINTAALICLLRNSIESLLAERKRLREALELVAVRFTPALDGYCWCSRRGEPDQHKPFCLIAKQALTAKPEDFNG